MILCLARCALQCIPPIPFSVRKFTMTVTRWSISNKKQVDLAGLILNIQEAQFLWLNDDVLSILPSQKNCKKTAQKQKPCLKRV